MESTKLLLEVVLLATILGGGILTSIWLVIQLYQKWFEYRTIQSVRIGSRWLDKDDPFSMRLITVLDIKNGYVQYNIKDTPSKKYDPFNYKSSRNISDFLYSYRKIS